MGACNRYIVASPLIVTDLDREQDPPGASRGGFCRGTGPPRRWGSYPPPPPGPPGGVTGTGGGTGPQVLGSTPGALEIPAEALGSGGPQRAPISCWPWIWEPVGALRGHEAKGPKPPGTWGPSGGPHGAPGPFSSRPRLGASRGLQRPLGNPRASSGISRAPGGLSRTCGPVPPPVPVTPPGRPGGAGSFPGSCLPGVLSPDRTPDPHPGGPLGGGPVPCLSLSQLMATPLNICFMTRI